MPSSSHREHCRPMQRLQDQAKQNKVPEELVHTESDWTERGADPGGARQVSESPKRRTPGPGRAILLEVPASKNCRVVVKRVLGRRCAAGTLETPAPQPQPGADSAAFIPRSPLAQCPAHSAVRQHWRPSWGWRSQTQASGPHPHSHLDGPVHLHRQ